jgi:hypothetical protein
MSNCVGIYLLCLGFFGVSLVAQSNPVIPLHVLVEENYQLDVKEWKGEGQEALLAVAQATCESFNRAVHVEFDRTNEVGIAVERLLQREFEKEEIFCEIPETLSGRRQSAGYPDLEFHLEGQCFYLEVKVFSSDTIESGQRTFYFSVSDNPKVTQDAFHLLMGFEISKMDDANYRILGFHIRDLRNLPCKVKIEYNASNRDLYGPSLQGFTLSGSTLND